MDKFDSLRKSIRQILEQEDQLGRMSPENSEKSRLNPETQLDQKTLKKILLQKSYKLNNVVFDNMLHFLFTAKALGDIDGRFKYVSEYIGILFKKISRVFSNSSNVVNRQDDYEEQKRLSASYIIKNLNSLLETKKSSSNRVRPYEPNALLHDLRKIDNITSKALSNAGLPEEDAYISDDDIERVITQIDTGFGHFVELALFEVLNAISVIINKKFNIQTESGLDITSFKARYLDLIKTREEHFHKAIDYFYIYYLFAYDKTIQLEYIGFRYDTYNKNRNNARQEALSNIANEFFESAGKDILFEITKSLQVLRNKVCIEQNNDNLVWIPGIKDTNKKGNIEYDLWLIDSNTESTESNKKPDCYAKIDIKAYKKDAVIELSSVDHNEIEKLDHNKNCRYYGLINLEKQAPFIKDTNFFTNVTLSLKMFLFDNISMKNQKSEFVKNEKKPSGYNRKTLQFDSSIYDYTLQNANDLQLFLDQRNEEREKHIIDSKKEPSQADDQVPSQSREFTYFNETSFKSKQKNNGYRSILVRYFDDHKDFFKQFANYNAGNKIVIEKRYGQTTRPKIFNLDLNKIVDSINSYIKRRIEDLGKTQIIDIDLNQENTYSFRKAFNNYVSFQIVKTILIEEGVEEATIKNQYRTDSVYPITDAILNSARPESYLFQIQEEYKKDVNFASQSHNKTISKDQENSQVVDQKERQDTSFKSEESSLNSISLSQIDNKNLNTNLIKKYFDLNNFVYEKGARGSQYYQDYMILQIDDELSKNLINVLKTIDYDNFPVIYHDLKDKNVRPRNTNQRFKRFEKSDIEKLTGPNKQKIGRRLLIDHQKLNSILEDSLEKTFEETELKIPLIINKRNSKPRENSKTVRFSILDDIFLKALNTAFKNEDIDKKIYDNSNVSSKSKTRRNSTPKDLVKLIIQDLYQNGLLYNLNNQYKIITNYSKENNIKRITTESHNQTKSLLRSVIRNILENKA